MEDRIMEIKKRIYISGPMSGVTRAEYLSCFSEAERRLRARGYTKIVNPTHVWACRFQCIYRMMERLVGSTKSYWIVLLYDLWLLTRCDTICLLPGWEQSRGASIEKYVADKLGLSEEPYEADIHFLFT